MRARRVAVKVDNCVGCGQIHLRAELVEYLPRPGFLAVAKLMRARFMDLAAKTPWTWQRRFTDTKEAERFAVELCQTLREPCFFKDGRVYAVPPVPDPFEGTRVGLEAEDGSVAVNG